MLCVVYALALLPVSLLPALATQIQIHKDSDHQQFAIGIDVRNAWQDLSIFPGMIQTLQEAELPFTIVFLDTQPRVLIQRFSETRRPHPLALDRTVAEGLAEERRLLEPIRRLADQVLDTSALTVHELRRRIRETVGAADTVTPLVVTLVSFGFRHGVPEDADLVFDVRFLPNPHFVEGLRPLDGRDARVRDFVLGHAEARELLERLRDLLEFLLPFYQREGKAYLTIAIGCTGGRHRSVTFVEMLRQYLEGLGYTPTVVHRDIDRE